MVVRDDRARRLAPAAKRLLKERFGGCSIAVLAQQHVDDLAVLVDGAVQVPLVVAAKEEHLVDVPVATERPTVFASFSRQLRPKCLNPAQHGPVGHVDASLGEQLHDARSGEWVAQIPAYGHQDHVCWPAVARKR